MACVHAGRGVKSVGRDQNSNSKAGYLGVGTSSIASEFTPRNRILVSFKMGGAKMAVRI